MSALFQKIKKSIVHSERGILLRENENKKDDKLRICALPTKTRGAHKK